MREGHPHRAVDAEQLPGAARELRDGGAGAGGAQEGRRQDAARTTCSSTSTRCARRGSSSTGSRTRASRRRRRCRRRRRRDARWRRRRRPSKTADGDLGVKVEAQFAVGEYEIVILSAKDSTGLDDLAAPGEVQDPGGRGRGAGAVRARQVEVLRREGRHQEGEARRAGRVQLSPLRFHYDANELRLPVRLGPAERGRQAGPDRQHPPPDARYEVANYKNTFIPTNLDVADDVRNSFAAFYAALFDATVEKMGRKVVVTEYAWQTTGVRSVPDAAAVADDLATLGPDVIEGIGVAGRPPVRQAGAARRRAEPQPFSAARRLGADAAARALRQGDAVGGSGVPRGEAGDGRARQLERHQRRRGRAASPTPAASTTSRGATSSATTGTGRSRARTRRYDNWGGPPGNPFGGAGADGRQGAGDGAARQGRAQDGGALAGAAARHRRARRRRDAAEEAK